MIIASTARAVRTILAAMRALAIAFLLSCLSAPALAQSTASSTSDAALASDAYAPPSGDRPTSGDASIFSGRTLGVGNVMIAAGAGWPGAWARLELAPTSTFNLGIRAGFDYGSPMMGLVVGLGGVLSVPMRLHVWGEHDLDLAIYAEPIVAVGQAAQFGETATALSSELGYAARLDAGARLGWEAIERTLTLVAGLTVGGGFAEVPKAAYGIAPIGAVYATLGLEILPTRDFMMFVMVNAGYGLAPFRGGLAYYPDRVVLDVSLGGAFLL